MNYHDYRDELPFWKWMLYGQVHARTGVLIVASALIGLAILRLVRWIMGG